jgi:hypothetical protein
MESLSHTEVVWDKVDLEVGECDVTTQVVENGGIRVDNEIYPGVLVWMLHETEIVDSTSSDSLYSCTIVNMTSLSYGRPNIIITDLATVPCADSGRFRHDHAIAASPPKNTSSVICVHVLFARRPVGPNQ